MCVKKIFYISALIASIAVPTACDSGGDDSDLEGVLFLALPVVQAAAAAETSPVSVVTCSGSELAPVSVFVDPGAGAGISDQFLSAGESRAYPVNVTSSALVIGAENTSFPLDLTLSFCGTDGATLLQTEDGTADEGTEVISITPDAPGTYYLVVSGHASDDTGSFSLDASDSPVTGGGSCTNMGTTPGSVGFDFTDSECINFEPDTTNPATACANLNGTYSTSVCSELNVQGRCTSIMEEGVFTVVGYTGNFADDSAMQASCSVDIDTALSTPQFIYQAD